ncbi:MAG: YihA family ribosome biogenesis GTP-binding protein [Rhodospirillaceae bacterium]|nr:YihA family ribosome biogenesis GTP-binding protein [Rhodospirillaceae bacterium]|tara:strand:+ start:598 stop:1260 length:663 start_codon:yes stop_codon:yes gene_type:complete
MPTDEALGDTEASGSSSNIEHGRLLFAEECTFVLGADKLDQLPKATLPEIAFAGRSNVGKSSLVNALTGRKALARISNTPGRTQQLNFFQVGNRMILVDLPGYGYAKVSRQQVEAWTRTLKAFLRGRVPLRRICLLVDARRGIKDLDREIMDLMDASAVVYQVVLTKIDKIRPDVLDNIAKTIREELEKRPAAHPVLSLTSSQEKLGIAELRANLAELVL